MNRSSSSTDKPHLARNLILLTTLEASLALIFMFTLPKSESGGMLFGYSASRQAIILGLLAVNFTLFWIAITVWQTPSSEEKINAFIHSVSIDNKKAEILFSILSTVLLAATFLLVGWLITEDKFLLGYLTRVGPLLIFGTLAVIQVFALLISNQTKKERMTWIQSVLLGILLITIQEWPLVVSNKLNNFPAIAAILCFSIYTQILFRLEKRSNPKKLIGLLLTPIITGLLIYLQLFFIPKRFLLYHQTLYTFSPIILLGLLVMTDAFERILGRAKELRSLHILVYLTIVAIFIFAGRTYYIAGKTHAEQVNTTYMPDDDELGYMEFAIKVRGSNFRYTGIRNQMPVYPFIQALFYKPGENLDDFYSRGKQVNIILSLASLAAIFLIAYRFLSLYQAVNITLVSAFGLYVFKSGYFMVELLYYTIAFAVYVTLCLLLLKPSKKIGVTAGILLGIAHLTKASILPALLLFIGVFLIKDLVHAISEWRKNHLPIQKVVTLPNLKTGTTTLFLVIACFLLIVSPYLAESKIVYGRYFYNVNSTFYMWYDSYEEAIDGTISHGDVIGWPDMPEDKIPSPGRYFQEHTFAQILDRIKYGIHWQVENIRFQYGFFNYPVFFFIFTIFMILLSPKQSWQLAKRNLPVLLFGIGYFFGYLFLYIWYSPIANLPRFIYALYLPLIYSFIFITTKIKNEINLPLLKTSNILVMVMVFIDIWYLMSYGPFVRDFGS